MKILMDKTSISCTIKIFKYLVFKNFQNKSEKKCPKCKFFCNFYLSSFGKEI